VHVALLTTFAASRKEPLADMLERIGSALAAGGFGESKLLFILSDGPFARVSSIDRVLKRFPDLRALERHTEAQFGVPGMRVLSNRPNLGGTGEPVAFATLLEVSRGVPKSFPFHNISLHFSIPMFSSGATVPSLIGGQEPGISITDSWWVSGRQRSLSALTIVDAEPSAKKLPQLPAAIAALFAACGKVKKTLQVPLADLAPIPPLGPPAAAAAANEILAVLQDHRGRMAEIVERARLPHDLPSNEEARATTPLGLTAGPRKPELVRAFAPMGYDCRGESGMFTLGRRTPKNLTAELELDVGTWSHSVTATYAVQGLVEGRSFQAPLSLPVAPRATPRAQYPIGDADRWRQIVENLAALVAELERSFVPAIENAAGPAPLWFRPEA
jgi:hypothetical protein